MHEVPYKHSFPKKPRFLQNGCFAKKDPFGVGTETKMPNEDLGILLLKHHALSSFVLFPKRRIPKSGRLILDVQYL